MKILRALMLIASLFAVGLHAAPPPPLPLPEPPKTGGKPLMQALAERRSVRAFTPRVPDAAVLSELLWAANGVNRPDGRRTAPSARNRQNIEVYLCTAKGVYRYDAPSHSLQGVSDADVRFGEAPVCVVLVSNPAPNELWTAMGAGAVSQNISLYCASAGLGTYPRVTLDHEALTRALALKSDQKIQIGHPVGYPQ